MIDSSFVVLSVEEKGGLDLEHELQYLPWETSISKEKPSVSKDNILTTVCLSETDTLNF